MDAVSRMNINALCLKFFCLILVVVLIGYIERPDAAVIASIWFAVLDSYYLGVERFLRGVPSGWPILSPSVWGYYGLLVVISLYV